MASRSQNSLRALVAIPHEPFRVQVCAFLGGRGFQVSEAASATDALSRCGEADLVLAEASYESGSALADAARASHPALKILLISGEPAELSFAPSANLDCIEKPFSWRELLGKVVALVTQ